MIRIALIGYGNVGQAFARMLRILTKGDHQIDSVKNLEETRIRNV